MTGGAISKQRWQKAQASELAFWQGINLSLLANIFANHMSLLEQIDSTRLSLLFDGKDVLEIGCGPLGFSLASFYRWKSRIRRLVKVDPLPRLPLIETAAAETEWAAPFVSWAERIALEGEYVQVPGEQLPFDREFDTVISYNVIDHVQDPAAVLRGGLSSLRPGGNAMIAVDCLSVLGRLKFEHVTRRKHAGTILVDAHPHSFLPHHVRALLRQIGFVSVERLTSRSGFEHFLGKAFRPIFLARRAAEG
jgi:SAM-dependent methyltransferase